MTRPLPHERPTLAELSGKQPMQIAGQPADVCPYCGAAMIASKSTTLQTRVDQYRYCRNEKCGRKFFCHQPHRPPAVIVREIDGDQISNVGTRQLTVHRETA